MSTTDHPDWTFEPARAADAASMRQLAENAYRMYVERLGREPAPMTSDYESIAASGEVVVVRHGDRDHDRHGNHLAAMLVFHLDAGMLLINNIAVDPVTQGSGLGSELLAHAECLAVQGGADEIRLYTNEAMVENVGFYLRRGYRETHRAQDDGYSRVYFTKQLRR